LASITDMFMSELVEVTDPGRTTASDKQSH